MPADDQWDKSETDNYGHPSEYGPITSTSIRQDRFNRTVKPKNAKEAKLMQGYAERTKRDVEAAKKARNVAARLGPK